MTKDAQLMIASIPSLSPGAEAEEALTDVDRLVESPDHASKSGLTDRVIGYSHRRGELLCVICSLQYDEGINAWPANNEISDMLRDEMRRSEQHVNDDPPKDANYSRPGREAAKVYTVRLAPTTVAKLEQIAGESGATTSAIIRGFIDDGLAARDTHDLSHVLDRLDADIRLLRSVTQ